MAIDRMLSSFQETKITFNSIASPAWLQEALGVAFANDLGPQCRGTPPVMGMFLSQLRFLLDDKMNLSLRPLDASLQIGLGFGFGWLLL